ncbi:hypothetical protein HYPDE_29238 [Hyphomicrobium denitrificans 1NES1]|uniref:Uncharacterized protein n=1 Tax=Hyphomicrobium denitrificans 1NES1 TaxID=670307 RepID=N0B3I5_9HYPH|nr:zinc-finger-containing protein [Hyphomicrobium denitrificans]AGK57523.1 hypothetical protein HYPDE_29238 [Hyphomicrobium denitrificans 1NES1]
MTGFSRQGSQSARKAAYRWLASTLALDPADCHIGMFDLDQCHWVIVAVREWHRIRECFR